MSKSVVHCIWVVEDHPLLRSALTQLLSQIDTVRDVRAFPDAESVLAELNNVPAPDLVVMDIGLPGMDGAEATKIIKDRCPETEILILTVHEDNETIFQAICAGASGYLLKTDSNEAILRGVDDMLNGGAPLNSLIARRLLNMFNQFQRPGYDYGLTEREQEILKLMVEGLDRPAIAEKLFLSPLTIGSHAKNIYTKLHVHNRGAAVAKAIRERLV